MSALKWVSQTAPKTRHSREFIASRNGDWYGIAWGVGRWYRHGSTINTSEKRLFAHNVAYHPCEMISQYHHLFSYHFSYCVCIIFDSRQSSGLTFSSGMLNLLFMERLFVFSLINAQVFWGVGSPGALTSIYSAISTVQQANGHVAGNSLHH